MVSEGGLLKHAAIQLTAGGSAGLFNFPSSSQILVAPHVFKQNVHPRTLMFRA